MGRWVIKSTISKGWGFTKWLVGWPIAIVGLGGLPDSLDVWSRWIEKSLGWLHAAMTDPRVQQLATAAVSIADFINQSWVRAVLVCIGFAILAWGWRPFWRFRHKLWFLGKRALNQKNWIPQSKAVDLVENSRWGRSRKALAEKPRSVFTISNLSGLYQDPARDARIVMFHNWCKMVLEQFEVDDRSEVRMNEELKEYSEGDLIQWLDDRYRSDIIAEFGKPG
jgi:hypothetical protein